VPSLDAALGHEAQRRLVALAVDLDVVVPVGRHGVQGRKPVGMQFHRSSRAAGHVKLLRYQYGALRCAIPSRQTPMLLGKRPRVTPEKSGKCRQESIPWSRRGNFLAEAAFRHTSSTSPTSSRWPPTGAARTAST